jgi:hypothetical protein
LRKIKKNCDINDDFDLISWFEALPPSRIHPTKELNPSPPHENCKTEFTSASILATGHNNLVRNCVNDCTDANNLKLLREDVDNNSSPPPQSKGKYLSAPLNSVMGDKEEKNDKGVEMKVNTIGLSFKTPGKAFISGRYSIKGVAEQENSTSWIKEKTLKNKPTMGWSSTGSNETNIRQGPSPSFLPPSRSVASCKSGDGAEYRRRHHQHFQEIHHPSGNMKCSATEKELDFGNNFTEEKSTQQSPSSYIPPQFLVNRSSLENYNVEFIPRKSPGNNFQTTTTTK